MPQTKYAQYGDLSLAYQVFGEGSIDLVLASSFISHVELAWTTPESKSWYDRLGSFCRVQAQLRLCGPLVASRGQDT